jgi:osmotically-inducible protein OsmY
MKQKSTAALLAAMLVIALAGCSTTPKSPDVADAVQKSLKDAGYKDVSVSQDRDKGVVKLTGSVPAEQDKARAEQIARSLAAGQVVADEIAVLPPGAERAAKDINADVDKSIEKLLDAALIQNNLHDMVKYSVKNSEVTLTGSVNSQALRSQAQTLVAGIPNVQHVVNELQVKEQKATGSS